MPHGRNSRNRRGADRVPEIVLPGAPLGSGRGYSVLDPSYRDRRRLGTANRRPMFARVGVGPAAIVARLRHPDENVEVVLHAGRSLVFDEAEADHGVVGKVLFVKDAGFGGRRWRQQ